MNKLGTATRNRQVDSLGGTFYGGGTLRIYTGTQPATPDTAPTGDLIVEIELPATAFSPGSSGVANKTGVWSGTALIDADLTPITGAETPGWFRIQTSGDTHPFDGVCGEVGDVSAQLKIAPLIIVEGQTVSVGSGTMTQLAS